jgi:hypothetical protein
VLDHEADRRATLPEARVLEGRELEETRAEEEHARQALRPGGEPRGALDDSMEARVGEERSHAEERPDSEVPGAEKGEETGRSFGDGEEHAYKGKGRGQHHRDRHQGPRGQEAKEPG